MIRSPLVDSDFGRRFVDLRQAPEQPTAHEKETSGSQGKFFVGI